MPPEKISIPPNQGWNLQLQKKLSEVRLLFAMQRFTAELIISGRVYDVNSGFSFTKRDFRLQNGKYDYNAGFSFTKWDSRSTNGILELQFTPVIFAL